MKEQILKLRAEGKSYKTISEELNCSKSTVSYYCTEGSKEKVLERTRRWRAGLSGKPLPLITDTCILCNKKVKKNAKKYCSHKCQKEGQYNNFISSWLKKEIVGHGGMNNVLSNFVRKYMLELNNNSCSICSWNKLHPVDNKPLVEIDHIDGDSKNSYFENLRVLCPNCHSETPTFRARNKKSSRLRNKNTLLTQ